MPHSRSMKMRYRIAANVCSFQVRRLAYPVGSRVAPPSSLSEANMFLRWLRLSPKGATLVLVWIVVAFSLAGAIILALRTMERLGPVAWSR
jgi:hypothetical protein